jgi:hypothetical protein
MCQVSGGELSLVDPCADLSTDFVERASQRADAGSPRTRRVIAETIERKRSPVATG